MSWDEFLNLDSIEFDAIAEALSQRIRDSNDENEVSARPRHDRR